MKALVTLAILVASVCAANADTIRVPADQPTIQAGIQAAADQDIVLVAPGEYRENLDFLGRFAMDVVSESGALETTLIPADPSQPAVLFGSDEFGSYLVGFTITGGTGDCLVKVANSSRGGVKECIIRDFQSGSSQTAAVLVLSHSRVSLFYNLFVNNSSCMELTEADQSALVMQNTFAGNHCAIRSASMDCRTWANIFVNSSGTGLAGFSTDCDYNCFWNNGLDLDSNVIAGPHNITVDPMFTDTEAEDYTLRAGSPCVNGGQPGRLESDSTRWEMGAFQYPSPGPLPIRIGFGIEAEGQIVATPTPSIHWTLSDIQESKQSRYEIEVGTDGEWSLAEMWSTGPVASADTEVVYSGGALTDFTKYFVRMRVHDGAQWGSWQSGWFATSFGTVLQVPAEWPDIQSAVNATSTGDTVLVAGGLYRENVILYGNRVKVFGAGAAHTTIEPRMDFFAAITLRSGMDSIVQVSGFTFAGGVDGEDESLINIGWVIEGSPGPEICNNTIRNFGGRGDKSAAIRVGTDANIHHNLFYENGGTSCVSIYYGGTATITNNTFDSNRRGINSISGLGIVRNNIVTNSTDYGIYGEFDELDYNCVWNNNPDFQGGPGPGPHGISEDPLYAGPGAHNYSLLDGSPCINAGDPDPQYNDPDGSPNDMGAFPSVADFPIAVDINYGVGVDNNSVPSLNPTIYWTFRDNDRAVQTMCEVEVGIDDDWTVAELWDTGPLAHTDTFIVYDGAPLEERNKYHLRIRLNDGLVWGDWMRSSFKSHVTYLINVPSEEPTIQAALNIALDGDTVLIAPGTYFENLNFVGQDVILASEFVYSGDTADVHQTIIDGSYLTQGGSLGSVIRIVSGESLSAKVIGFTITGGSGGIHVLFASATISHNTISANVTNSRLYPGDAISVQGGDAVITHNRIIDNSSGIRVDGSDYLLISDNIIRRNTWRGATVMAIGEGIVERNLITDHGSNGIWTQAVLTVRDNSILQNGESGIYANYSILSIEGNVIAGNGRGITSRASQMDIVNNTIVNNCGLGTGGGIYKFWHNVTTLNLTNNILWGNCGSGHGSQIYLEEGAILNASHNDIQGGQVDIQLGTVCTVNWLDGNIDSDPQFVAPLSDDYSLLAESPCIDAGDPDPSYNDPDGTRNDIGARPVWQGVLPGSEWIIAQCDAAELEGTPLLSGWAVKAYDVEGTLCGMANVNVDGGFGPMLIYGDDPATEADEGAEPGEPINFEIHAEAVDSDPGVYWTTDGDQIEVCGFYRHGTHRIPLWSGWNLVSWHVDYAQPVLSLADQLGPCLDVILGFDQGGLIFDPDLAEFSTMDSVDYRHGYWIRVSCDTAIEVQGERIPVGHFIIVHTGWNLVGYWPTESYSPSMALASIMSELRVAYGYDRGMEVYLPEAPRYNNLELLRPGHGYWLNLANDRVLSYPGFGFKAADSPEPLVAADDHPLPSRTWISVYGASITLDGKELRPGALIEVLTSSGIVCGSGNYVDGSLKLTPVYGFEEESGTNPGYPRLGEPLVIRIDSKEVVSELSWDGFGARVPLRDLHTARSSAEIPLTSFLSPNYPNPFNPSTTIEFGLATSGQVRLEVFNILGQQVAVLADGYHAAGRHGVTWNGMNKSGRPVSSGLYFYRLESPEFTETRKLLLIR